MSASDSFAGFSRATVSFFTALRKNNNRDWFAANKDVYEREVIGPAKLFVTAMGERLRTRVPGLVAVPAVNKSIFRIYRDTRFSLDPSPYKTNLGLYFWDGARPKMESAGFYFQIEPPEIMMGGGMYMIPDALLSRYRRDVVDPKRGAELERIIAGVRKRPGLSIGGEHYKRVPAGFDPGHPNADLLKHKGLYIGFEAKIPEELYSPRLVDYCLERFEPAVPLNRWLMKLYR